ncbi:beta-glucosidase [Enterococcus sp. FDAARGOS_553]|uniref:glycoside hydrolase family 3 protein n=1 Tax=Enterococcus TaxID=1350 RepID=UPI000BBBD48B|nr:MULTISPECIES: glycoside hydrolase family 3 N-terminal domain-containing protein [Enterococcus]AYY09689.1 beta-glucosidase [Enterococcus sp. FDAARGOS_553]PCD93519.1 beta-glucosidase [Enterococcus gallinarum]
MIEEIVKKMSLKEKIGQLNQRLYGWQVYQKKEGKLYLTDYFKSEVARFGSIGWIYGVFRADPWSGKDATTGLSVEESREVSRMIQDYLKEHTRLGIPAFLTEECPHGHQGLAATTLPVNFSTGASWNPDLYQSVQTFVAQELRAKGAQVGLISTLDIVRDPRWGRTEECFSEDPYLASCFTQAAVKGMQGEILGHEPTTHVLAVLKHFAAQGSSMGGHNAGPVNIGEQELREIHLPAMLAGIQAGALGCMAAYNDWDGVPCHANPRLLQEILREEAGFAGVVMADGCALDRLADWLGNKPEAAARAMNSGVDISLWDNVFPQLEAAVDQGLIKQETIDQSVMRVLKLKEQLGLFDEPVPTVSVPDQKQFQESATRLAEEAIVLLKNEQVLPLKKQRQTIAVIGPHSKNSYHQLGDYTPFKELSECRNLWEGLLEIKGTETTFIQADGCGITEGTKEQLTAACQAAATADQIILTIGGSSIRDFSTDFDKNGAALQGSAEMTSGENIDLASLALPECQKRLITELKKFQKPLIGIVIAGRPHLLSEVSTAFDALLFAGYPGQFGGSALARILFGETNPSGKLAVSIPDENGQLPVYYNYRETAFQRDYTDCSGTPRYGFGYGLSYAEFMLKGIHAQYAPQAIQINGTIENLSVIAGAEVVQVYLRNYSQQVLPRVKVLCGFQKVFLPAKSTVDFSLTVSYETLKQLNISPNELPADFIIQVEAANQKQVFTKPLKQEENGKGEKSC